MSFPNSDYNLALKLCLTGIRKTANCAWVVDPSAGSSGKFLALVTRTHNRQGIAKGSPLCCNYGLGYDLSADPFEGVQDGDSSRIKKFRGALDAVFSEVQATDGVSSDVKPGPTSKPPPPTAPQPVPKPATPQPVPKPATPQAVPKPATPQPVPQPVPDAPKPEPKNGDGNGELAPSAGAAGKQQELASGITEKNFTLVLLEEGPKLAIVSNSDSNHKLPPRTPLLLVKDAMLVEQEKPEIPLQFKTGKDSWAALWDG